MEILRHFKFVHDVYKYYTRDLYIANDWIKSKYNQDVGAVFLGADLKKDFADIEGINIIFTERSEEKMKQRSTTAYTKILHLREGESGKNYSGKINVQGKREKTETAKNFELEI